MSRSKIRCLVLAVSLAVMPVHAQSDLSRSSDASLLPVAALSVAPALLLSVGAALTVVAVEKTAEGSEWIVERASDGARASVRVPAQVLGGASLAVGTAITVTAISAGYVLSCAGRAIAFVPNEIGAGLMYTQRVSQ